ncbi:hypothetical protein LOTGIDRAFT_232354 [Lottia gigantea]|uniref:Uncharacterized protein n=1 Tax=Lottia gigantea TaxID=225164 RepID=V4ALQ3_LOTGI|nr:hypothetical protein LOTGIDRAFT_232354 [Lottia gigantea]ESO94521.1 hypothetical protein LOTGIDRAFT_232354 [Lottia gigantea]
MSRKSSTSDIVSDDVDDTNACVYGQSARELVTSQEKLLYKLQDLQYELLKTDNEVTQALEDIKCRIASVRLKSTVNKHYSEYATTVSSSRRTSTEKSLHNSALSVIDFKPSDYSTDLSSTHSDCTSSFNSELHESDQSDNEYEKTAPRQRRAKRLTILR